MGAKVGPIWTIAPEMRRNAEDAHGGPADTYSLAKTLWILLTKEPKGFDGQYNWGDHVIRISKYQRAIYSKPLDDLLHECTENDPSKRPGLEEFANRLEKWIVLNQDYFERNPLQWKEIQDRLFPTVWPARAVWETLEDIIAVLKVVSSIDNLNHMFLPQGGGQDLDGVCISREEHCIELKLGSAPCIAKPNRLLFESLGFGPEWNYFRLETNELEPVGEYEGGAYEASFEPVTEIEPDLYTDPDCWIYDDFDGERLPDSARRLVRVLRGDFVIFGKISPYNLDSTTYDARHSQVSADKFREYIEQQALSARKDFPNDNHVKTGAGVKFVRPSRTRQSARRLTEREVKLLKDIIRLARERDSEEAKMKKRYRLREGPLSVNEKKVQSYLLKRRPKHAQLMQFLERLDREDLIVVAAVMYGVCDHMHWDRAEPLEDMINGCKGLDRPALSIAEKASLVAFLEAGIRHYASAMEST